MASGEKKKEAGTEASSLDIFDYDWAQLYRDQMAGVDRRVDYDSLKPDEKQFLECLQASFDQIPPSTRERMETRVKQFIDGDIGWSELDSYPPELLYHIAKIGQSYVELSRFAEAETIFKGLAILDHKNYYYHGVLGSIYQKQKRYIDALTQYGMAILLNPEDIPSYTNRGECWLKVGLSQEALADFEQAMALGDKKVDKWANRARILHKNLLKTLK